jgi:aminoglycoside 6'-N-acetyltransferase
MSIRQEAMITFKKLAVQYLPLLYTWFQEPHVMQWWPVPQGEEFFDKFLERIRSKDTFAYLVLADEITFGYIQYYRLDVTGDKTGKWLPPLPSTTVGIDQFIGAPTYLGKGYGTNMIIAFIEYLRKIEPMITTVIVDPEPENTVAIKCYKKVGFEEIGEFKTPYGKALLMRKEIMPS